MNAARKLPANFEEQKATFHKRITKHVADYCIPDTLIINWDQTGIKMVPVSEWKMDAKGSKEVSVTGLDDKRVITGLLACAMDGEVPPPQILYAGKSEHCHPRFNFPKDWHIYHSESHWTTADTMLK